MAAWTLEEINTRIDEAISRSWDEIRERDGLAILTMLACIGFAIAFISLASFVIGSHADGYRAAGVNGDQAAAGAVAAQVFVAAATVAALSLFRAGRRKSGLTAAVVAAGLLVSFAVLPNAVAGESPLTMFLAALTSLLLHVMVGAIAGVLIVLTQVGAFSRP